MRMELTPQEKLIADILQKTQSDIAPLLPIGKKLVLCWTIMADTGFSVSSADRKIHFSRKSVKEKRRPLRDVDREKLKNADWSRINKLECSKKIRKIIDILQQNNNEPLEHGTISELLFGNAARVRYSNENITKRINPVFRNANVPYRLHGDEKSGYKIYVMKAREKK